MAQDDFDSNSIELVSIGTPDRRHDITIRNEQDHVLPELVLGEINIAGPCVSPGYFHNADASQKAFIDGRFRSGDLGFFYKGEIYFYGRRDDMVIVGGRNLIPEDIEETAEELSFVRPTTTCLLATENDTTGTTELTLLIEANSLTPKDTLKNYAATTQRHIYLTLEVLITRILFCAKGTVEKTSSGKKRRNVIRTRLINNQLELVGS